METFEWTGFWLEYNPEADVENESAVRVYSADYEDGDLPIQEWDDLGDAMSDIDYSERFPMTLTEWQKFWDWVEKKVRK